MVPVIYGYHRRHEAFGERDLVSPPALKVNIETSAVGHLGPRFVFRVKSYQRNMCEHYAEALSHRKGDVQTAGRMWR